MVKDWHLERRCTAAVRDYAFLPDFIYSLSFNQSRDGVECASHFECAYALEILAFEEQPDFGLHRLLTFPLRSLECFGGLWGRNQVSQCGVG